MNASIYQFFRLLENKVSESVDSDFLRFLNGKLSFWHFSIYVRMRNILQSLFSAQINHHFVIALHNLKKVIGDFEGFLTMIFSLAWLVKNICFWDCCENLSESVWALSESFVFSVLYIASSKRHYMLSNSSQIKPTKCICL